MHSSSAAFAVRAPESRTAKKPVVWLLMGARAGDNNQLCALANALGWPFETKHIEYNQLRRLPFLRNGLTIVTADSRALIKPPWPDLVICVGYRSVTVARYIREQRGGRTKLVHIGNPRDPLDDFDLQITTPQYSRKARNLLELPFPIGNPARTARPTRQELEWLERLPKPRRLVAVGGPARSWELDHQALDRAIRTIRSKQPPGSLIIAVSSRTRPATRRLLERLASGSNTIVVERFPGFPTLLATSDEIYVTADSVSMLSEAVLSGKPVGMIPIRRSLRGQFSHWLWERPSGRRMVPDFPNFWKLLRRRQAIGTVEQPVASRTCDTVEHAAEAVRAVMARREVSESAKPIRIWALLGAHAGDNNQVLALAEALGLPFEVKQLQFNRLRHLGPRLLGRSLVSLTKKSHTEMLREPPPDLTISAGHRSVAVVRALRRRSAGRTRSIHIGFPRLSPAQFDLVITTPQYPIADDRNVLHLPLALTRAGAIEADGSDRELLAAFPTPRRLLVIGGPNIYWKIDQPVVLRILNAMVGEARADGGSVIVTSSPRTPRPLQDKLAQALARTGVPSLLAEPGKPPRFGSLLAAADSIRITGDSVSMASEAIRTGKPVAIVPVAASRLGRIAIAIMDALGRPLYPQDLRAFWRALADLGVTDCLAMPRRSSKEMERQLMERLRPIVDGPR